MNTNTTTNVNRYSSTPPPSANDYDYHDAAVAVNRNHHPPPLPRPNEHSGSRTTRPDHAVAVDIPSHEMPTRLAAAPTPLSAEAVHPRPDAEANENGTYTTPADVRCQPVQSANTDTMDRAPSLPEARADEPQSRLARSGERLAARPGLRLSRNGRGLQARSVKRTNPLLSLAGGTTPLDPLTGPGTNALPALSPALYSGESLQSMGNEAVFMFGAESDGGVPRHTSDVEVRHAATFALDGLK